MIDQDEDLSPTLDEGATEEVVPEVTDTPSDDAPSLHEEEVPSSNEPTAEQKREIANWINQGVGLSDVQKRLNDDFGISMTYMDVRFLVDDLDLTIQDEDEPEPSKESDQSATSSEDSNISEEPQTTDDSDLSGQLSAVSVTVDKVTRPGVMASGVATFSDGVDCPWYLDQFGRLGLMPKQEGYKPPDGDLEDFQKQLDAELRKTGI
tara:strand:- start:465 stop:1085 length:621 start_codon:yes stop_codon:yes gene_type:complete